MNDCFDWNKESIQLNPATVGDELDSEQFFCDASDLFIIIKSNSTDFCHRFFGFYNITGFSNHGFGGEWR